MKENVKSRDEKQKKKRLGPSSKQIPFSDVYAGPNGLHACQNGMIRSTSELKRAFPDFPFASEVDLKKYDIVYVATGLHRTTGFKVEIYEVTYTTNRGGTLPPLIEVSYRESPARSPAWDRVSHPMHLIKLQKLEGEVVFNNSSGVKR
jgi:hypothetical protein